MASDTENFLQKVLSNPGFHIPIEANFIIGMQGLNTRIIKNLNTNYNNIQFFDKVNIADTRVLWKVITDDDLFLANGVSIPGETLKTSKVGYSSDNNGLYGGFLSSPVFNGRGDTGNLSITFLETNKSFLDYVIRPWIVAASHYGYFAKSSGSTQNFKTDITITFLDKTSTGNDAGIRKIFVFHDAVPINLEGADANYGGTASTGIRTSKISWTYSTYEVNAVNLPSITSFVSAPKANFNPTNFNTNFENTPAKMDQSTLLYNNNINAFQKTIILQDNILNPKASLAKSATIGTGIG
jgi:hypothetical protein